MFYSRHFHSARVTISADRAWHLRVLDSSVRKVRCLYKRTVPGGVTEAQEGATGVGGEIRVGGGNGDGSGVGDGNGDVNGHGDGDGAGVETGVGVNEGAQDGNGDGSGDRAGMGTEVETHRRTPDGNGDGPKVSSEDGNGTTTRVGSGMAKKRLRRARNR